MYQILLIMSMFVKVRRSTPHVIVKDVLLSLHDVREVKVCLWSENVRGTVSEDAFPAGGMRLHYGGGCQRNQELVSNCFCGTSLCFAVCDWHVPRTSSYHKFICRLLSVICAPALFSYSATLTCLALLYPTFGKRGSLHFCIGPRVWSRCYRARVIRG